MSIGETIAFVGLLLIFPIIPSLLGLVCLFLEKTSKRPGTPSSPSSFDPPKGIGGHGDFPDEETAIEWSYI